MDGKPTATGGPSGVFEWTGTTRYHTLVREWGYLQPRNYSSPGGRGQDEVATEWKMPPRGPARAVTTGAGGAELILSRGGTGGMNGPAGRLGALLDGVL